MQLTLFFKFNATDKDVANPIQVPLRIQPTRFITHLAGDA